MGNAYYRPIAVVRGRAAQAAIEQGQGLRLAGGEQVFCAVECLSRGGRPQIMSVADWLRDVANDLDIERLSAPRAAISNLQFDAPRLMGILNVTPDSFSDGGEFDQVETALAHGSQMVAEGADILDIGGESTRPGSDPVALAHELTRVIPVIEALSRDVMAPLSIDSRKAEVMSRAVEAGATIINDVSALTFDPQSLSAAAASGVPVVLMHAQGDPKDMQEAPHYDNVLLDVYDYLSQRVEACVEAGVPRSNCIVDPGIGFGKTLEHNLTLLSALSLFHGLGCPVMLGASRKSFIANLGRGEDPHRRLAGSIASVIEGAGQGVQIFRVHDVFETRQALDVWSGTCQA